MKKVNFLKTSMIALSVMTVAIAGTMTSCGDSSTKDGANTAENTNDMKKAPYEKKFTNADFYDADGTFKQDVAKEAFLDMFEYYDVPFTPFMEENIWFADFGLGDYENAGMGGIFWINDSVAGYFAHDIYLLPGQMIPEHKHVETNHPAKMESWKVDKGWAYNFSEIGDPTEGAEDIISASQLPSVVSRNYIKQVSGEIKTLKEICSWHFLKGGSEGAIINEYANFHDGCGLVFSNKKAVM